MSKHKISTELMELENRLRTRADPEPPADLRARVLHAVAAELAESRQAPAEPRWQGGWWAAVAAGLLVVMSLSMISGADGEFSARAPSAQRRMASDFQAVQLLESQLEGRFK